MIAPWMLWSAVGIGAYLLIGMAIGVIVIIRARRHDHKIQRRTFFIVIIGWPFVISFTYIEVRKVRAAAKDDG